MHPELTQTMPMIAFKIYKKDAPFDKPEPILRRKENPNLKGRNNPGLERLDK